MVAASPHDPEKAIFNFSHHELRLINVTFIVCKNTTESGFSINRCLKLIILTTYINIKKREGVILLSFRCKFYASMLFIHVVYNVKSALNIIDFHHVLNISFMFNEKE